MTVVAQTTKKRANPLLDFWAPLQSRHRPKLVSMVTPRSRAVLAPLLRTLGSGATAATRSFSARYSSPVVLYHATYDLVPEHMSTGVHNVRPLEFFQQIDWLSRSHRFLSVDEWFEEGKPAGTAVVTFDDGYNSVSEHALPGLIERGIPATVFLNGASLTGEVFWRDKVLFIINTGRVQEFLDSDAARNAGLDSIEPDHFYKATKHPDLSSRVVDHALQEFLAERGLVDEVPRETARSRDDLVDHRLVTYGNHSFRHYIPSSLTADEQRHEIFANEDALDDLNIGRSKVYSIPFGGAAHINRTTEELVREGDFTGVLFSSNAVNFNSNQQWAGLPTGVRYMAPASTSAFKLHHSRLSYLRPDAKIRSVARGGRDRVRSLIS